MTWIVGASSLFGYGVILSDIRVTVGDQEYDILKKSYALNNCTLVGFAGSVKIGFMLLDSLSELFQPHPMNNDYVRDPIEVARHWSPIAKKIFSHASRAEQKAGSQILIVAADPFIIDERFSGSWDSKIYMIRFAGPDFKPQIMKKRMGTCSIGSGAKVKKYQRNFRNKQRLGFLDPMLKAEVHNPNGWADTLAFSLFHMINQNPQAGISKHMHIQTVRRGEVTDKHKNIRVYMPDNTIIDESMPKVAKSYAELQAMLDLKGINIAGSIC